MGVGYVISGMYFGWNLGLIHGGPYGLLIALLLVTVMYVTFISGYAELACSMPRAGGAFVYSKRALGPYLGFITGLAQIIEFVFAPPAIAAALGAYFTIFFPEASAIGIAILAYALFTALNIWGLKLSALFEIFITIFAVIELLIFVGIALPRFSPEAFSLNPLPHGYSGVFAALPYAIWFYLGIEGVANIAEETRDPKKNVSRGFALAMGTLVILALLVFFAAVGVAGWEAIVFPVNSTVPSDAPLPLALSHIVGQGHFLYHLLVTIGLFGLVASFHGIILAGGRASFGLGRSGFAPKFLGKTIATHKTPGLALLFNSTIGIIALLSGKTGDIITLAVFGALTLYIMSMISLFALRAREPDMDRPFRDSWYPVGPAIALVLAIISLIALSWFNPKQASIYLLILALGSIYYRLFVSAKLKSEGGEKNPLEAAMNTPGQPDYIL